MLHFIARIDIMPHEALLDPQGKAVLTGLAALQLPHIQDVRVGKHLLLRLTAPNQADAEAMVTKACKELLANPVMESYSFELQQSE
jgi:phosphoribosylformylglycinamidine synthase